MENTTLKCHCGNTKELDYRISNMGDVVNEGWGVVSTFDGKLLRACPKCHEELVNLAKKIVDITGNKYVSLSSLIK